MQQSLFDENIEKLEREGNTEVSFEKFSKMTKILLGLNQKKLSAQLSDENTPRFVKQLCVIIGSKSPKYTFDLLKFVYGTPRTMPEPIQPEEAEPLFEQHSEILTAEDLDTLLRMDKLRERVLNHIKNK